MSSKVTGDAQPDAGPDGDQNKTLPTEIVDNSAAGAGALTVAEGAEPAAESGAPAESGAATSAPGPEAELAPEQPTETMDAAGPGAGAASAEPPAGEDAGAGYEEDEDGEYLDELSDPAESTELIAMTEPVDMAEPVERRRPRRGWQSALIALGFVVAAAAIVGGAIAIVGSLTHGFKKPVVIHYKKSAVFSLKTGQCIDPNGQTATIVSCAAPHDAEVFATFELPGSKWPGTAAVGTAASSGCSTRLNGYLNPQLAVSLASTYIYPDSVAWQAGTRTVICEVRATNGQLTGSVAGASTTSGLAPRGQVAAQAQQPPGGPGTPGPVSASSTMPTGAGLL
jgi:putative regulator of septum formation